MGYDSPGTAWLALNCQQHSRASMWHQHPQFKKSSSCIKCITSDPCILRAAGLPPRSWWMLSVQEIVDFYSLHGLEFSPLLWAGQWCILTTNMGFHTISPSKSKWVLLYTTLWSRCLSDLYWNVFWNYSWGIIWGLLTVRSSHICHDVLFTINQ